MLRCFKFLTLLLLLSPAIGFALKAASGRVAGRGGAAERLELKHTLQNKMQKLGIPGHARDLLAFSRAVCSKRTAIRVCHAEDDS